jgi:hypothetical protein
LNINYQSSIAYQGQHIAFTGLDGWFASLASKKMFIGMTAKAFCTLHRYVTSQIKPTSGQIDKQAQVEK